MTQPLIFVSHASFERHRACVVADLLTAAGATAVLDPAIVDGGATPRDFAQQAAYQATYCLLLWSRVADLSPHAKGEWGAAFVRDQNLRRRFLLVGRLENYPPPTHMHPRLNVDLFPHFGPAINGLARLWQHDTVTAERLGKAVVPARRSDLGQAELQPSPPQPGHEVYVSSELFECALPVRVDLDVPTGAAIDETITRLSLPRRLATEDRRRVHVHYRAQTAGGEPLRPEISMRQQGIGPGDAVLLDISTEEFAMPRPATAGAGPVGRPIAARRCQPLLEALELQGLRGRRDRFPLAANRTGVRAEESPRGLNRLLNNEYRA